MASIVYDGVAGNGDLFRNIKFFIAQRVPLRTYYKGLVESNGGEIVALDKQADMVIFDHMRKDAPAGSYSYTFIEKSVKHGQLEDASNHLAGPKEQSARPVGSSQPARTGRTKFTPEDDDFLMRFCARAERLGQSMRGNTIYEQLALANKRHTSQSWRDRWIKHVSLRPRPAEEDEDEPEEEAEEELEEETEEELEEEENPPPTAPSRTQSRSAAPRAAQRTPPRVVLDKRRLPPSRLKRPPKDGPPPRTERAVSKEASMPGSLDDNPFRQRSRGGNNFTEAETEILTAAYGDIDVIPEDSLIDAWIAWAQQHNNHTAQEWRNHFEEYVKLRVKTEIRQASRTSGSIVSKTTRRSPRAIPAGKGEKASTSTREETDFTDTLSVSSQTSQLIEQSKGVLQHCVMDEQTFEEDVRDMAKQWDIEVNLHPQICEESISLFRLWNIVIGLGGFDKVQGLKLWPKVAKTLGFKKYTRPQLHKELHDCYSEVLADLEGSIEHDSPTESEEDALISDQLNQDARLESDHEQNNEQDEDTTHDTPRPQANSAEKRRLDPQIGHSAKRQRSNKGKELVEIPSTPDSVIDGSHAIESIEQPSRVFSTPVQRKRNANVSKAISAELYPRTSSFQEALSPSLPRRSLPSRLEPETQDFEFQPSEEVKRVIDYDMATDLTPSPAPSSSKLPERGRLNSSNLHASVSSSVVGDTSLAQAQTTIREQIGHWQSMGWDRGDVIDALHATGLREEDLPWLLDVLNSGTGIPDNKSGVWTYEDDEAFDKPEGSHQRADMVTKHGIMAVRPRKKYLKRSKSVLMSFKF